MAVGSPPFHTTNSGWDQPPFLHLLATVTRTQPMMKPRREPFSSSSLASSHPASAGRPKGEIANAISSPAIPVEMSFSTNSIRTLSSPSTDARMESKPAERLSRNESTATSRVSTSTKGAARILLSRTHPDLVKGLFAEEVAEIRDGTVTIESIAREAGSRTKIAVWSSNPNVDPVGACVGLNGTRVNNIVNELNGEKIDIVNWDDNPGNLIQNALSPAKIVAVFADPEEKSAKVVVPDYQLSLAIGREGQNARLAARLTGYKIDIKDETQAKDAPGFRYEDYLDGGDEEEEIEYVDENGNPVDENGNPIVEAAPEE